MKTRYIKSTTKYDIKGHFWYSARERKTFNTHSEHRQTANIQTHIHTPTDTHSRRLLRTNHTTDVGDEIVPRIRLNNCCMVLLILCVRMPVYYMYGWCVRLYPIGISCPKIADRKLASPGCISVTNYPQRVLEMLHPLRVEN